MNSNNDPEQSDTPDGRPARAQRELENRPSDKQAGFHMCGYAGAIGLPDIYVDGWNVSSYN